MAKKKRKKRKKTNKNDHYHSWISYFVAGMGAGVLVTNSYINPHPVRWGLFLLLFGILIYFAEPVD